MAAPGATRVDADDIAAAAVVLAPFVVAVGVLAAVAAPDAAQRAAADPVLQSVAPAGGVWLVVGLGVAMALAWPAARRPDAATLRRALGWGALGAAAAAAVTLALRAAVGDHLPAFIPAEESAGPGLAQGLAAGVGEELVFRLGVAAAVYLTLARRLPRAAAIAAAAIVTGAMFALAHELPPAGGSFALDHVVTRALIPGAAMTAAFLVVHPAFLVAAHAAAHLLIPFLFR